MQITTDVVLEAISDGYFALDPEWRFAAFNGAAERAFDVQRADVLGRRIWDVSPGIVGSIFEVRYRAVMDQRVAETFEAMSALRPGHYHEISAFPLGDGIGVTFRDITERRERENALRESEARLRLAIGAGRMAVWEWEAGHETIRGSPDLNALLGFPADAVLTPDDLTARYLPGERERIRAAVRAALERGDRRFAVEFRFRWLNGTTRWLLLQAEIRLFEDSTPRSIVGVLLDITDQKSAAERQALLVNELNHRVKNTLATVQSIGLQSLRSASSMREAGTIFEGRILALAKAHNILTAESWVGADLHAIVAQSLNPFERENDRRFQVSGPPIRLPPSLALGLAMTLHELATNAVKYGALSNETGHVVFAWNHENAGDRPHLALRWQEAGGPPVQSPKRRGFGTRLIEHSLSEDLAGKAEIDFAAAGVVVRMSLRLDHDLA